MPQPNPRRHTHLVSGGVVAHHGIWCTFGRRQGNLAGVGRDQNEIRTRGSGKFPRSSTQTPQPSEAGSYFGLVGCSVPSEASGSHHEHRELVEGDELLAVVGVHCGMAEEYTARIVSYASCRIRSSVSSQTSRKTK